MKATVDKKILAEALGVMTRVVERRNTIPILANVLLKVAPAGHALALRVSNLDIEMEMTIAANVADAASTTVPAAMLHDIVARMKDGADVLIEDVDRGRAVVRAGRSRFTLPSMPESDFPELTHKGFAAEFDLRGAQLAALLGRPAFAIGRDPSRPYLSGIYLHALKSSLRGVACDGHRMARLETPLPPCAVTMPAVIVPEKTAREMAKLAEPVKDGMVRLQISPSLIRLVAGPVSITSKLIDGTYPDYERIVPSGNDKTLALDVRETSDAVARMLAVVERRSHAVRLSASAGGIKLDLRRTAEGIEAVEEVDADFDAEPLEIGFQSGYLAEALGSIGGKTVKVRLADPASPAIFLDPADDGWLTLLMPCRV